MTISLDKIGQDYKGMQLEDFRQAMHRDYNGSFDKTIGKFVDSYKQSEDDTIDDVLNNYFKN